jgi:hypothetical protein
MNPNQANYRQTTLNFSRSTTSQPPLPQQPPKDESEDMDSSSIEWSELPKALTRSIQDLARKYAAIACKSINLGKKITTLAQHKANGTIPDHLKFKFNKLLSSESNDTVRASLLEAAIDGEILEIRNKVLELNNLFTNRVTDLKETLGRAINQSNLALCDEQVLHTFNTLICEFKFQFLVKQQKDEKKKDEKKQKFLEKQEQLNEVATLSMKQVIAFKKEISTLKNQLKDLSLNKSKNQQRNRAKKRKKSVGTSKNANGRK